MTTLKFKNRPKQEAEGIESLSNIREAKYAMTPPGAEPPEKEKGPKKLERGDYFGEVSFLYDCRRTCSVKSTLYATLGCLPAAKMMDLFTEYPSFKKYLKRDCINNYDDDLKLFLVRALTKIDYLRDASQDILMTLAFACNAE